MSNDGEILATLTDDEVLEIVKLNSEKESIMLMLDELQKKLTSNRFSQDQFFKGLREKYCIPDGSIYLRGIDKTLRKGIWREEN